MKPFILTPFVKKALDTAFPEVPSSIVYVSSHQVAARLGLQYLRILVRETEGNLFPGEEILRFFAKGYNLFLVNREKSEAVLLLFLKPLPFERVPEVLDWPTINLAAVSRVHLPVHVLEEVS